MNPTSPSLIVIRRPEKFWAGGLRSFIVRIDGRRAGKVKRGMAAEFPVVPGEHLVAVSMDWVRSRPVRVVAGPESRTELAIGSRPGGARKMFVPIVLIVFLAQAIIATLWATMAPADSGWVLRTALFLVAYAVLFGSYVLVTAWFAGDYWALLTLESIATSSAQKPGRG